MNINEPIQKYSSHVLADIRLLLEEVGPYCDAMFELGQKINNLVEVDIFFFSVRFHGFSLHRVELGRNVFFAILLFRCGWDIFLLCTQSRALPLTIALALLDKFHINYL